MKISISCKDLLDGVNKVKTVVAPKSALPILSHILMETGEGFVRLTATDLKVSIECQVDCQVYEEGSLTVNSQRLSSVLSELPQGDLLISLSENSVINLKSGRIETKLFSMSPDEFPAVRSFEGIEPIVVPQKLLKRLFWKTSYAICTDQARYNLTGLLLEVSDGKLIGVATDGRRMAMSLEREGIPTGIEIKVIVPGKMIEELERLLGDDEDVKVLIDETQAAFAFGNVRLVTALIEGTFPNYEMVIPKKNDKEAMIDRAPFMEAVRRTRTMTSNKFNSVRFGLNPGQLVLKVVTPEVGEYEEEVPIEYEGGAVEIAFNPDFVLDVVRRLEGDKVCLQLKDANSPGLVKGVSESGVDNYFNVIMPIRI